MVFRLLQDPKGQEVCWGNNQLVLLARFVNLRWTPKGEVKTWSKFLPQFFVLDKVGGSNMSVVVENERVS